MPTRILIRTVIDTNVVFEGLTKKGGASGLIIDAWLADDRSVVAGLVLDQLGRLPSVGDAADWNGLHLEVVDMDGRRIDRVLVTRKPVADQ